MDVRRRFLQFTAVVLMAAANTAMGSAESTEFRGSEWCSNSCGGTWVCDPGGGSCSPQPCLGIDDNWYDYYINCNQSLEQE